MKSYVKAFFILSLTPMLLYSQVKFERTYGGSGEDIGWCVQQTSDNGYIITGYTKSFGAGDRDLYLVKTDSLGDILWTQVYGDSNRDWGEHAEQTLDGGYIIVGGTYSYGAGDSDVYLLKTDSLGDTLWTHTYGDWDYDKGNCVRQTSDLGYIIVGTFYSQSSYGDVYILKTDSLGDTLWTRIYGEVNKDEWGSSIQETPDGGYIIVGGYGGAVRDLLLLKVDSLGDTLWIRTYGDAGDEWGACIEHTFDGGYIIAGGTNSYGAGHSDIWVIKIDTTGDTLWTQTYGGSSYEWGYSVQQTLDSGYIIAGWTDSFGFGYWDVFLIRADTIGDTLWTRTFGGAYWDRGHFVRQTSDLGYIVVGYTSSFGSGNCDVYLIKTDSEGTAGIEERDMDDKSSIINRELSATPNPFNVETLIRYVLSKETTIELAVFNILGEKVKTLVNANQKPGTYSIHWDGKDENGKRVASGIYLYRLKTGNFTNTKKLLILR